MPRMTRNATARNLQSRKAEQRPTPQNEERDPLWLPKPPPGFVYGWIRRAVLNQEDAYNIRERQMQGWKPIPADRHPELMVPGWEMVIGEQKGYIENAGLIACECPAHLLAARKRLQDALTASRLRMPHIELDRSAKAPTFDESQTGFERVVTERRNNEDAEFKE